MAEMRSSDSTVVISADNRTKFGVVAAVVALAAAAGVVADLLGPPGGPYIAVVTVAVLVCVLAAVFTFGTTRTIAISPSEIRITASDGTAREVSRREVAHLQVRGPVWAGRTIALGFSPQGSARVVFTADDGKVVLDRKLGWFRVRDVIAASSASGIRWLGVRHAEPHMEELRPTSWPSDVEAPRDAHGCDDLPTRLAIRRARTRARLIAFGGWIVAWAGVNGAGMFSHVGRNRAVTFVTWCLAYLGFIALFFVMSAPARNRAWRSARRILKTEPWTPVEALVTTDPQHPWSDNRLVSFIDPETGQPGRTMMVTQGGEHGWLQPLDRGWFVCAVRAGGRRAVLAPPDRRAVAQLDVPQQRTQYAWRVRARMPVAGRPSGAPMESSNQGASTSAGFEVRPG